MFPVPQDSPAFRFELSSGVEIATPIRLNLGDPIVGVRLGGDEMLRASMPETSVYENCEPCTSEHDVGTTTPIRTGGEVDPIPQTIGVKQRPNSQLRLRVTTTVRAHGRTRAFRGGPRHGHKRNPRHRPPQSVLGRTDSSNVEPVDTTSRGASTQHDLARAPSRRCAVLVSVLSDKLLGRERRGHTDQHRGR